MKNKVCTRCNCLTEFYVEAGTDKCGFAVLCSDCCMQFINWLGSIGKIKESDFVEYAKETKP